MPAEPARASAAWRDHWFPLAFFCDLEGTGPHRFKVFDQGFVLFRDGNRQLRALLDRCPHRGARLSDGALRGGNLECPYHGWQFGGDGGCVKIPQLSSTRKMPSRACVESFAVAEVQGMIWLWPGAQDAADESSIPTLDEFWNSDCRSVDFAIDLPYEQTFLVENVIDIAHIHVAHHGVRGGGDRALAAPLTFEISEIGSRGFSASFRSEGLSPELLGVELDAARVEFSAPNLVLYRSIYADEDFTSGLALYSCPTGRGACRLLYRAYSNFRSWRDRLRPRWWEHHTQCTILEQDLNVVRGQVEELRSTGLAPRELWLPLKSSDAAVLAYRRWLDVHASSWPYEVGFSRLSVTPLSGPESFDRYSMHTKSCASCRRAERVVRRSRLVLRASAFVLLAAAAGVGGLGTAGAGAATLAVAAVTVALAGVGLGFVARRFR